MRIFFVLMFFLLSHAGYALGQAPECSKLSNGMQVCLIKDTRSDMVFHSVMYKVGGVDDFDGKSGLAHFLEHMMFKGTKKHKNFVEEMSSIGASYNAMTGAEMTIYYEIVRLKDLQYVMDVEADRMQNLIISNEEVEREKNVVQEERLMRVDNIPSSLMYEEMNSVFYRTPYSRPVIGWMTDIKSFSVPETREFYKQYYRPDNALLFVIGNLDLDKVISLAEKTYGHLKNKKGGASVQREIVYEPEQYSDKVLYINGENVAEDTVSIWYRAPNILHGTDSYRMLNLLSGFLASGRSGELYEHLVVSKKIAKSVFVEYSGLTAAQGSFIVHVVPVDGILVEKILPEVDLFFDSLSKKISINDLKSVYKSYRADTIFQLDSLLAQGIFYFQHIAVGIDKDILSLYSGFEISNQAALNDLMKSIFTSKKVIGYLLRGNKNVTK